jgi:2-iminobutanoate/2-iminopropanoate deaminase
MPKQIIETAKFKLPPGLPFSKGVKKGKYVLISGTASFDEHGEFIGKEDVYKQTRQTLKNVLAIVEEAGGSIDDIVKINIYLKSASYYEDMNNAYKSFFAAVSMPARTTIEANLAYEDFLVEIDAEAILD